MTNEIQQPKPFDLVGDPVLIAGIGQGFEATLNWRVHDGHDERTGFFNVGGGTGEHGQFQVAAAIGNAAFQLDRLFVEVFEESAQDGSEINKVIVPVVYGPRIVSGYIGFRMHVVRGNIVNCPPDPEHVTLGMKVRLATYSMGNDSAGTAAINYGFEPAG